MKRIGRYQVEGEIGRGAMGVVYLAHDPRVGRPLAVKTYHLPEGIQPEQETEYRQRFLREAQSAGILNHPAIVTIYDADEDTEQGISYIAMEYVPGKSLRDVLREEDAAAAGRTAEKMVDLVASIADALNTAHTAGIVHRDVKPANILVRDTDGSAKIADFGVAHLSSSELTHSGQTLGSPAYMSPEQIRGRDLDGRSDLFSLAVILYEALSGERPFAGDDLSALAYSVVHETPIAITRKVPSLPAAMDAFFERALAKDPDRRFEDGATFAQALGEAFRNNHTLEEACRLEDVAPLASALPPTMPMEALQQTEVAGKTELGSGLPHTPVAPPERPAPLVDALPHRQEGSGRRPLIIAVALLLAMIGLWAVVAGKTAASLTLDVKTGLSGTLTVIVDGKTEFERNLSVERKSMRAFGKKVAEWGHEDFESTLSLQPGEREVLVRLLPEGASQPQERKMTLNLDPGASRKLKISAGRPFGGAFSVKLQ